MKKKPHNPPEPPLEQAQQEYRAHRFAVCAQILRDLLAAQPQHAPAWLLLGNCLSQLNELTAAAEAYRQACALVPAEFQPYFQLGCTLQEMGDHSAAVSTFERACAIAPTHARARCALGISLARAGRREEAQAQLLQAARDCAGQDPRILRQAAMFYEEDRDFATALQWAEQARSCAQTHRTPADDAAGAALSARLLCAIGDPEAARTILEAARARHPQDGGLALALGGVYLTAGRERDALTLAQDVTHTPGFESEATGLAAHALEKLGRLGEAEDLYRQLIAANPMDAGTHQNFSGVLLKLGRTDDAVAAAKRAVELNPQNRSAFSNFLFYLHYISAPSRADMLRLHQQWAQVNFTQSIPVVAPQCVPGQGRIRVGFVSADFRAHAVAFFFLPLLRHLDRERFDIFCYHAFPAEDTVTRQLRALCPQWRDISRLGTAAARAMIVADGIEILIDLGGHTAGNRLDLFAARSAVCQLTWLGYPDTTGLAQIDGRIVDECAEPAAENGAFSTEKLYRLTGGFHCYLPPDDCPPVAPPPVLAGEPLTFGSFNQAAKISAECVALWAAVLQRVGGSRLLLKAHGLEDLRAQAGFRERFARHGIDPERILFAGQTAGVAEHLAQYARVDIALDPFPYNGTTTTCEALWMGVPVLTRRGDRHCSRMGWSLLSSAGLPGWVAATDTELIETAARHASDIPTLSVWRNELRETIRASALFDAPRFSHRFGELLQAIRSD